MSRLIDAEKENAKLLDFIAQNDTAIAYAIEHKDMTMLEGIFAEYFEAQETAYDVNKVIEQVEKERAWRCEDSKRALGYAIGYIRGGGVE